MLHVVCVIVVVVADDDDDVIGIFTITHDTPSTASRWRSRTKRMKC